MKDIPGFEGRYAITKDGRVWSHERKPFIGRPAVGQWLKERIGFFEYKTVFLRDDNGKGNDYSVHRLVLLTYLGQPPTSKHEANHINGNKLDNRIENLEWVTSSENRKHAWAIGLIKQTENRARAAFERGLKKRKLQGYQATEIRKLHADGINQTDLAKQYGVDRKSIFMIIKRIIYAMEV
jgi:hypothetical protein